MMVVFVCPQIIKDFGYWPMKMADFVFDCSDYCQTCSFLLDFAADSCYYCCYQVLLFDCFDFLSDQIYCLAGCYGYRNDLYCGQKYCCGHRHYFDHKYFFADYYGYHTDCYGFDYMDRYYFLEAHPERKFFGFGQKFLLLYCFLGCSGVDFCYYFEQKYCYFTDYCCFDCFVQICSLGDYRFDLLTMAFFQKYDYLQRKFDLCFELGYCFELDCC